MRTAFWVLDQILGKHIALQTRQHLTRVAAAPARASRDRAVGLLEQLAAEQGPHVVLGKARGWKQAVRLPLIRLVQGHSIITGGTGSGKTMAACLLIEALLQPETQGISFGLLDAKGELFARTLYLIGQCLQSLPHSQAQRLRRRVVVIDLSSRDPLTSYNIACPWEGSDLDYFAQSRVDTMQELFPSGNSLSLRGAGILKHAMKLMADVRVPFSYFDRVLSSEAFRNELLARSSDDDLQQYFHRHFPEESRATIAAVRARVSATLLSSQSIKLALSGKGVPDFQRFQDEGKIVLINCGGPNISKTTARTLQSIFLSDISRAVFQRKSQTIFLWLFDEAAQLLRNRHVKEAMLDLLTLARSYRSFCCYITQSLATAVQDGDALESFLTNIKWSLSLRCGTARDVSFLERALPVTGTVQKPRITPYATPEYYRPSEERALRLSRISSLPDRVGWLWLKSLTGEALRIRTRKLTLPEGRSFQSAVSSFRNDPNFGHRISRSSFLAEIAKREAEFMVSEPVDKVELLKKAYQEIEEGRLWNPGTGI